MPIRCYHEDVHHEACGDGGIGGDDFHFYLRYPSKVLSSIAGIGGIYVPEWQNYAEVCTAPHLRWRLCQGVHWVAAGLVG